MNRPSPSQFRPFSGPGLDAEPTERRSEPSHDALPPGTRLAEYEILSVLGQRGSGILYLAMDHGLKRQVAIKEYLPAPLASRDRGAVVTLRSDGHAETFTRGLESFVDEARLLARFDHPALARVHRFWEANGTAYMVMPYYEGITVGAARRAMASPPDEAWLHELLSPLLGALELLHTVSCYPQDISPETILLRPDGRPVLLDLGTACHVVGNAGQAPTVILEPGFVAIEQYAESSNLRRGPWTNLYSLGALAYYCIGGSAPMAATIRAVDDQMEPLFQVVDRLGRSFPELDYSVAFVSAIERALRVRPQERPQSVAEFRRALLGGRSAAESMAVPHADETETRTEPKPQSAWEARRPFFLPPDGQAPLGSVDDADDAALREALDAALRPDPDDVRRSPQFEDFPETDRGRRTGIAGVAAVVLVVLGVGGWMMWPEKRDADVAPRATALSAEPEAEPVPLPPPERPAEPTAPPPTGTAAEPQAPPPETAAPAVPGTPRPESEAAPAEEGKAVAEQEATVADASAEASPPRPPVAAEETPSPPPPERLVTKEPDNPRELCEPRTHFSLYYCMKSTCERSKYYEHPECQYLRKMDSVRTVP